MTEGRIKVVETSVVSDDILEDLINEWSEKGYRLQNIDYIMGDGSRRPQMAFLFFLAPAEAHQAPAEEDLL